MKFELTSFLNFEFFKRLLGIGETPLLPADSRQVRPLTIVVAIMCGLGCLAALTVRSGFRAADNWTNDLESALTVLVSAPRDEQSLSRAVVLSRNVTGVASASLMPKAKAKALLRTYGANIGALIDELPLPSLIEVGLIDRNKNAASLIETELKNAGFTVEIDDHSRYSGEILRTSMVLRGFALLALLALIIASVASIGFAARAALETRRDAVEILHLVGAEDAFVAREVQARFMRLGLIAGGIGALGAGLMTILGSALLMIGASSMTKGADLLKWYDVWILFLAPIVTAVASAIAARIAARSTLKELV
jgi:cell division transport system permease protein